MPLLHEGYDIGRAFGLVPVACVMCSIRDALDCEYCDGSMVRMVPPGWTADDAVGLPPLRYKDLVIVPGTDDEPDEGYMVCDDKYAPAELNSEQPASKKRARDTNMDTTMTGDDSTQANNARKESVSEAPQKRPGSKRRKSDSGISTQEQG